MHREDRLTNLGTTAPQGLLSIATKAVTTPQLASSSFLYVRRIWGTDRETPLPLLHVWSFTDVLGLGSGVLEVRVRALDGVLGANCVVRRRLHNEKDDVGHGPAFEWAFSRVYAYEQSPWHWCRQHAVSRKGAADGSWITRVNEDGGCTSIGALSGQKMAAWQVSKEVLAAADRLL